MSREKELIKNTGILALGTIFPKVASLLMLPIITGGLTNTEYGLYDLLTTIVLLLLPVATIQLQAAVFRFLIEAREDETEQKGIITNVLVFTVCSSAVVLTIMYFFLNSFSQIERIVIILYYFLDIYVITLRQVARGLAKNMAYSISVIIHSFCELGGVVIFLELLHTGLLGVLISICISLFLSAVYLSWKIRIARYIDFQLLSKKKLLEMIKYAWPMIPNSLSSWVMSLSDRLVVSGIIGLEANAIYAAANKIPNLFGIVQSTVNLSWQENASIASGDTDSAEYFNRMFQRLFSILFGCMTLLIAAAPLLFRLLIRGNYQDAYIHMIILFFASYCASISSFLGGIYIANKRTKEIGITTLIAAGINLLIDLTFVHTIGIYAASISTLVSYIFLVVFRMINIQRFQKINFNIPFILLSSTTLVIMCFLCSYQKTSLNIVNVCLAIPIAILANRETIKRLFAKASRKIKKD